MNQKISRPSITLCEMIVVICLCALLFPRALHSQTKLTFGQQIFLMKTLKPSLKKVGIITFNLSDEEVEQMTHASLGLGVKTIVARAAENREISGLYRKLITEYNAEMIWIPENDEKLILGVGMEFLLSNSIEDKVGLCVPTRDGVSKGALCCFQSENNKFTVFVNQRIAAVVGAAIPSQHDSRISYVVQ